MNSFLVLVIVVLSIVLIGLVLVQKSKGGGLAAGFQSANSTLGAPKTASFLEKASWSLMGIIAVLCIIVTINTQKGGAEAGSALQTIEVGFNENLSDEEPAEAPVEAAEAE